MSLQQAKNALVASLFELSNASTKAAAATVEFYRQAGLDGAEDAGSELNGLSASISGAADSVATKLNGLTNGVTTPRKKIAKRKVDADETPSKHVPTSDDATITASEELNGAEAATEKEKAKPEKKKRKVEKDPNAPKKPLTSYLRFNLQIRDSLRKERVANGDQTLPAVELNQIIADKWANLTNEEKTSLQQEYDKEYEVYKVALEKYKSEKQSEGAAAPADTSSAIDSKAPPTPKKKVTIKTKVDTEAQPEEKTGAESEDKSETKVDKKKKVKAAADAPAISSLGSVDDAAAKKQKKKKEKDSEDKKSKKKKTE